jgi:PAS domain S-box-containing protein
MALVPVDPTAAIIFDPLVVSPQTPLAVAIATLVEAAEQPCAVDQPPPAAPAPSGHKALSYHHRHARTSCVVVAAAGRVQGLLTERDVVRLTVQRCPLDETPIAAVLSHPVPTLTLAALADVPAALEHLRQRHLRYVAVVDDQGGLVGLTTDQSLQQLLDQRQTEVALRASQAVEACLQESEQRYAFLTAAAPVGIFRADLQGRNRYVNERWCQIIGVDVEAALGNGWRHPVHPEDWDRFNGAWQEALQHQQPWGLEYRIQQGSGTVTWVYGQFVPERDLTGQTTGVVGTLTDISDRKRIEQLLERREAHQRAIMATIPDLIVRINRAGIFQEFLASPTFQILGDLDDWVGTPMVERLPPPIAEQRLAAIEQALATQTIQVCEQDLTVAGTVQTEEVRIVPYDQDEVIMLVRDISDRKRLEVARRQAEAQEMQSQAILSAIPDLLFRVGADGRYRGFVTSHRHLAIVPQNENLVGKSLADVLPPELAARQLQAVQAALTTGQLQIYEQQVRVADRDQYEEVRIIKSGADEVLCIVRDISDRKRLEMERQQAEAALLQSERTNRIIIATMPDLLIQMDERGYYRQMLGGSTVQVKYPPAADDSEPDLYRVMSPELADQRLFYARQALATGQIQVYEQVFDADGSSQWEEVRIAPLNDHEVLIIIRDVTERKQSELALAQSEAHQRALISALPDLILRVNRAGIYLEFVTTPNFPVVGTLPELVGTHVSESLPAVMAQKRLAAIQRALDTQTIQFYEQDLSVAGRIQIEEVRAVPYSADEVLLVVRDISDRKQAEADLAQLNQALEAKVIERTAALQEREARYRALVDVIPDLLIRMDAEGTYLDVMSGSGTVPFNPEQLRPGGNVYGAMPLDHAEERMTYVRRALRDRAIQVYDYTLNSDGDRREEEARIMAINEAEVLVMIRDITARKQAEAQLQARTEELKRSYQELKNTQLQLVQAEKMSSLGQLVAGIAHEINNPVSFIYGNLNIAVDYVESLTTLLNLYRSLTLPPSPQSQHIQRILAATDLDYVLMDFPKLLQSMENGAVRIRDIVTSLRTFSRLDNAEYQPIDLHDNLESTLVILQNRLNGRAGKPPITVVKRYGNLPPVVCYGGLLNQVLMNLLTNAIDAIEERQALGPDGDETAETYEGCITLTTEQTPTGEMIITVQDNGIGMAAAVQAKIFDPFFTTKPIGVGTGMGLSISYQIITASHRGRLTCHSQAGIGTTFRIELPPNHDEGE